jgi:transposase
MKTLLDEIMGDRGQHAEKFREKIAFEVLFEGRDPVELAEEYQLAGVQTVNNWVAKYRERIKSGLVTLPPMNAKEKESLQALKLRVRELEKALEHANVLIYGLNSMIDYAEKELEVPIRKKRGTKR